MIEGILSVIISGVVHAIGMMHINHQLSTFSETRKIYYSKPLYDWCHANFADRRHQRYVSDLIHTGFVVFALIIPFTIITKEEYEFNFFLMTASLLYDMRTLCCTITILPKCREYGEKDEYKPIFRFKALQTIHQTWFSIVNGHG